jgi:hypothetical protein
MAFLNGIWADEYVLSLGIKDHLHELIEIDRSIAEAKNKCGPDENPMIGDIQAHYRQELADLFLLIADYLGYSQATGMSDFGVIESRIEKFRTKSMGSISTDGTH